MDKYDEILRALGRIEGELIGNRTLSERVLRLEMWHWWIRGAWAVLAVAYAYLFKIMR